MKKQDFKLLSKIAEKGAEIYHDRVPSTVHYGNEVGRDEDEGIIAGLFSMGLLHKTEAYRVDLYEISEKGSLVVRLQQPQRLAL